MCATQLQTDRRDWRRIGKQNRIALVCVVAGLLVLLGTASLLKPNAGGFGTHRQLGLPACTTVQLFGVRCPSCGMTTSWAFLVRGNVSAAVRANTGGALLGIAVMVSCPWLLWSAAAGRWIGVRPTSQKVLLLVLVLVMVTLVDWIWRLSDG